MQKIASYKVQITSYKVQIAFYRVHDQSYRPDLEAVWAGPSSRMQFKMHNLGPIELKDYEPQDRRINETSQP